MDTFTKFGLYHFNVISIFLFALFTQCKIEKDVANTTGLQTNKSGDPGNIDGVILSKHTFNFNDTVLGNIKFIPTQGNDYTGLHIYIKENENLIELPRPNIGQRFENLKAVAFRDINGDGLTDIIIVAEYTSAIGPTGNIPFSMPLFYIRTKKDWLFDDKQSISVKETYKEENVTIDNGIEKFKALYH
ncbi:hypothetical protein [Leptonema illini]|uniref:FG-GAP repeat protein n=1 Tax=Leptonema illini DSM 21528 TaxID=929563 RepID=H2CGR3_9LEPT|nr:hypothetical protein [Leptonema illini]EHQ04739.1 hypothetical protein Lepil_0028 [Leptonema illini DSM 21528]